MTPFDWYEECRVLVLQHPSVGTLQALICADSSLVLGNFWRKQEKTAPSPNFVSIAFQQRPF